MLAEPPPDGPAVLRDIIASGRLADLRWPDYSDYANDVKAFYEPIGFAFAWTQSAAVTAQAGAIVEIVKEADSKGLDPEDYDGSRWAARLSQLRTDHSPEALARFDLALTVCLMRYASDLHVGKWNPGLYYSRFNIEQEHYELATLIRQRLVESGNVRATLAGLEPSFPGYQRTQAALQNYLAMAKADNGEQLPAIQKPIYPGSVYSGLPRLVKLLQHTGDLPAGVEAPSAYSGPLVEAVKHFQMRHGLTPDGRIGKATLHQLNIPLTRRARQLQLTLERWRWVPHEFPRPPIVVNIPEFELRASNTAYTTDLQMKVVVGKSFGHQTPVFSAEMKYVVFRPYWDVPRSIIRAELLPKIVRDRAYLAKNGYEVVTTRDEVVTSGVIDDATLAGIRAGELLIRQAPGSNNSLGLVKFLFPNEYNVYLHATPATELFSRSRRDFSHGCIRVERPEALAAWVLRDLPEWTPQRISDAMHSTEPLRVNLPKSIPVLIVYATAVVLENGETHFFDDIYGQDAALDELASKGYPCPRWNPTSSGRGPRPHE